MTARDRREAIKDERAGTVGFSLLNQDDAFGADGGSSHSGRSGGTVEFDLVSGTRIWKPDRGGSGRGGSIKAGVEAAGLKGKVELQAGADENNPFLTGGAEFELASVVAKGDVLVGEDSRRKGAAGSFAAEATAAKVDGTGSLAIPFPGGRSLEFRIKGGAGIGVGASGGAHMYKDTETQRKHFGAGGGLMALIGLEISFDISFGPKYRDIPEPPSPAPAAGAPAPPPGILRSGRDRNDY